MNVAVALPTEDTVQADGGASAISLSTFIEEFGDGLLEQVRSTARQQAPFAAVLGCIDSRVPPELVFDQTVPSLGRSLLRAAQFFGGLPRQYLFDNPKTVVLARSGNQVRFQPDLLDLCTLSLPSLVVPPPAGC